MPPPKDYLVLFLVLMTLVVPLNLLPIDQWVPTFPKGIKSKSERNRFGFFV